MRSALIFAATALLFIVFMNIIVAYETKRLEQSLNTYAQTEFKHVLEQKMREAILKAMVNAMEAQQ